MKRIEMFFSLFEGRCARHGMLVVVVVVVSRCAIMLGIFVLLA